MDDNLHAGWPNGGFVVAGRLVIAGEEQEIYLAPNGKVESTSLREHLTFYVKQGQPLTVQLIFSPAPLSPETVAKILKGVLNGVQPGPALGLEYLELHGKPERDLSYGYLGGDGSRHRAIIVGSQDLYNEIHYRLDKWVWLKVQTGPRV
jgi:hypothetical protein